MYKLSPVLSPTLLQIIEWVESYTDTALTSAQVPGTSESERRHLMALGGVAMAIAEVNSHDWPMPIHNWMRSAPTLPENLATALRVELRRDNTGLGVLYEQIVSGRNRRRLGTFFTPPEIVSFLFDCADGLVKNPGTIIDPGAGVGAITLAARDHWPLADIKAVDINVVTLGLLAAQCALEKVANVNLILEDFLSWILALEKTNEHCRLIIGNPPYTRHQDLASEVHRQHRQAIGPAVTNGLTGLSTYFLAASLRSLNPSDCLVFVLPGNWTEANYGLAIRKALLSQTHRSIKLYSFPLNTNVFPGTNVSTLVLSIGPQQSVEQSITVASAEIKGRKVEIGQIKEIDRSDETAKNLGRLLWGRAWSPLRSTSRTTTLAEIGRIRRGSATGANNFFFLKDIEAKNLPSKALVPGIVRVGHVGGMVLDMRAHNRIGFRGERRWLLYLTDSKLLADDRIKDVIEQGEQAGLHLRYLTSHRKPWYLVEQVSPPHILLGTMAKGHLQAVYNHVQAIPSNAVYGIYLDRNPSIAPKLTTWLNSSAGQQSLHMVGRTYSGGLHKLEPRDLLSIQIPCIEELLSPE